MKTKLLKGTQIFIALFASASLLHAAGVGTTGGQFLRVGVGARAIGMGSSFSALADDSTAIYWNPAGLSQLEKKEIGVSYNAYFEDTASQFISYAHPYEKGVCALSLKMLSVTDIEKRSAIGGDADTPNLGTFKTGDLAFSVAHSRKIDVGGKDLRLGLALKYIASDLGPESASTFALDLGSIYHLNDAWQTSFAIQNIGGKLKFVDEGDPLPLRVKPGVAYKKDLANEGKLIGTLDADLLFVDKRYLINPGVEWWPKEMFAVRAGYQLGRDSDAGPGVSAGLGYRVSNVGIDYAFAPYGVLGNTHQISLAFKF
ncbi:PorV/PorQ family protein [Elusimicrobiota bacterium]